MAHLAVVKAVEARLEANFTGCPVYVENSVTDTPDESGPWITLSFPYAGAKQATIGNPDGNRYQEEGAFRILASVPRATGAHQARQWLDDIATLFRGKRFDGVRTYAPTSPISDDRNETGTYYRLSISVPFDFSLFG